jgi:hypothetical protein
MWKVLLPCFCFVTSWCFSQTGTVRGRVFDASTKEPLPFANVFIDNSTMGATSDRQGNFEIRNVQIPGSYELISSYVGYEKYLLKITLTDSLLTLAAFFLKPSQTVLDSVQVQASRDKEWEKQLKKFNRIFLGNDKEAELCTIKNPWVIDFVEGGGGYLVAKASEPIEIENKALGYNVKFFLAAFAASSAAYRFTGESFFEEMTPQSNEQRDAWRKAREKSYYNSKQHLFKSMVERRIAGEGFKLYTEIERGTRSNRFSQELGRTVAAYDTTALVENDPREGIFRIHITQKIEVHYMRERDYNSIYRDVPHPVSWVEAGRSVFLVNRNGFEINTAGVVTSGAMSEARIAHLFPLDYRP